MKPEEELINKYGKDSGMRVPEGYFPELERRIMEQLPPYVKAETPRIFSRWQRVKPYVYLAAMFCGIWLMMKVFHTATQPVSLSLDNPPQALVELLDGGMDYDVNYLPLYMGDFDADDEEFYMSYDNIEEFEKDFSNL
ncbi:MAG: hypothetical protein J1D77_01410 [Muribaculaceae bacterium]|nr:hypothetical protein [Muribaculaceae bacterium]